MAKRNWAVPFMLVGVGIILFLFLIMQPLSVLHFQDYIAVLFPKGIIGIEQLNLLLILQAVMLLVVLPVYALTFIFSWKYRADNKKATYDPDLIDSPLAEVIWWGLPIVLTAAIAVLTFIKTHELDPYRPIASKSDKKPMTIQVVALQWKWLFLYPDEGVASLNFLQFPEQTPIHFQITADAPMNSFWIPALGGQIYAMPSMQTQLYLIADQAGDYRGSSANLSGTGFANMHFIARASSDEEFAQWVAEAKQSSSVLDKSTYSDLAAPNAESPVKTYQLSEPTLFSHILMKYMQPQEKH